MARILGIESTCDETAAAVVADGCRVLSSVVASQTHLHEVYRGVVPEIASRAHIENILPVMSEALRRAGCRLEDIDAVAVASRPGLIGSLLVGLTAAKTLAWAACRPLIGVDHVHAHLYSPMLREPQPQWRPAVGLVVSGGHTALYHVPDPLSPRLLGSTIDDAVGEAYDKVAAILGLGYPGGPIIDRLAAEGDPRAVNFPRAMLGRTSLDFSFSGLKTSVLYHVRGFQGRQRAAHSLSPQELRDVAASFQAACVDVLVRKVRRALRATGAQAVIVGGGVSANRALRRAMESIGVPVLLPPLEYTTDNAAMCAGLGELLYRHGMFSPLDLDALTHSAIPVAPSPGVNHAAPRR